MSTVTAARPTAPAPNRRLHALWPALLAAPIATGANAPVLILPDMARTLGVPTDRATWMVTVFAWAMTVGTPLFAALVRHRGLKPTLVASAVTALAGTAALVLAPWFPLALAGRAAQAAGGAGLVAVAMNLAGSTRRMGAITAGFGVLGAVGPLLGSVLSTTVGARAPLTVSGLALLAVPAVWRHIASGEASPEHVSRTTPFDAMGAGLVVALASTLVLAPTAPLAGGVTAAAVVVPLALHIRRRPDGFVPAAAVRSRAFRHSALLAFVFSTSYFTLLFALPELARQRTQWSAGAIGTGQLAALLTGSALSWILAATAGRLGHRRSLILLITLGIAAPLTAVAASWAPVLLLAAATAVFVATGSNAVLSVHASRQVPPAQRPAAIGLFVLCYQLGGAVGPTLAALVTLN
ncbi:MFS transporter [Streptomyces venezuelae]|uniref:MFS transporter n=1 Tax=Streptomyces venezuelae TaxID=54571 RepID=A0A5P2CX72_STRVZ|nr:MFS transporter [Streptomyces venezuelae]QES46587.1 MFS transporter [Streptomyces venezuelae]